MASDLSAPPVLSTPAEHTFDEDPSTQTARVERRTINDDELFEVYEISRTASEIAERGWRRVALQFPDAMLPDGPRVLALLEKELAKLPSRPAAVADEEKKETNTTEQPLETDLTTQSETAKAESQEPRLYILADTSYSACCVDEIAAEHADAEGVVHYGRSCLSPTSRLPVIYVFTQQKLDYDAIVESFEKEFPEKDSKVVIMADVMFQQHVASFCGRLRDKGYTGVMGTEIVRDPAASIPNRKVILEEGSTESTTQEETKPDVDLSAYHLFHISTPPTSLLLTLSSRLASLRIYPTPDSPYSTSSDIIDPSSAPALLRRRYGLVVRFASASIIGILVNTLSVKNYLPTIALLKDQIAAAGKKSYTIVVGKLNPAKLANFAEMDGWVVVGCWESGLVESDGMYKPVITPFELALALAGDDKRIWDGSWWGGIEGVASQAESKAKEDAEKQASDVAEGEAEDDIPQDVEGGVDEEESEPPEFDWRTGKLVSHSRPMRVAVRNAKANDASTTTTEDASKAGKDPSTALTQRKFGELAAVNGVVSPGAEFLRSQRTWQGLGSDYNTGDDVEDEESTAVEEGRSGVARGYTVGEDSSRT
ncbi:2-(3-amino-3-carboxypropyl)histidine synthase subunit 2 [Apiospora rasikravindrae]|uniref:2-(3-amino-3-carboxypropyl)histidine synthase subunit 2 n=1 Tax=Apiospora rasikravindrae TaxID=990691 RepID=A0ABR1RQZ2_9PEZI